jgi:signal transduction histidine kinase
VLAVRGYVDFFQGRSEQALRSFEDAERVAIEENAPWVLYAVHRGRAHVLKARGSDAAAQDHAVLAESIAREHGSVYRARWVREEFGIRSRGAGDSSLSSPTVSGERAILSEETVSLVPGASRARRQLNALLRISQARARELEPDLQARVVVDELVQALRAERGFLFLTPVVASTTVERETSGDRSNRVECVAGRDSSGRDVAEQDNCDPATLHGALEIGAESGGDVATSFCVGTTPRRSAIAAPLVVDGVTVGVVYVDRALGDGVFTEGDGEILSALAGQVSIALELAQALRARERAEENLRSAEKMDAVARLARGIGHDVNNMLSAVSLTTEAMAQTPGANELVGDDIRAIQGVLRGASELARRLRDIAQGEFGHPEVVRVSARVQRLVPIVSGLLVSGISLDVRVDADAHVFIDPGQLDQVVTNLVINARDAMPNGGSIEILVQELMLDEEYTREHPRVIPGKYVRISVVDTGHGMAADVRDKIFEPYFTTKRTRGGTGLGLSSAYWIVSRSGGHIDVASTPGHGATFSIYFPIAEAPTLSSERTPTARTSDESKQEKSDVSSQGSGRPRAHT